MKNKIKGKLSSKKAVGNKMSEDEYTVHAFKFLVDNEIYKIESFKLGLDNGKIKDYSSLCQYYDFKLFPNSEMEQ